LNPTIFFLVIGVASSKAGLTLRPAKAAERKEPSTIYSLSTPKASTKAIIAPSG